VLDFSCRLISISDELMIAEKDRDTITEIAREYRVAKVVLFGSSIAGDRESHDIDLGVKGIEPRLFFRFYGQLMKRLSKPVDVVDLSQHTLFTELIEETGLTIYG
jgi:predicted nucleotidyltransferase